MCLNPGDILAGRYRIIRELGCGGFAITYLAEDIENPENSPCVIKEIPFPSSNGRVLEMARSRFRREARALETLGNHSCIPKLYDYFENNNHFYLVQEYIEGTPLQEELSSGQPWTEKDTVIFLREVLQILKCVHQAGIIHRDITPNNLIRRRTDRKIVLIDFGAIKEISTFTANSTGEVFTSQVIGTSGYMPPEQYNSRIESQPSNDIYSLGIIVIQALTGQLPANLPRDPSTGEIIWDYWIHNRRNLQLSDRLKNIVSKMVRFYFRDRYQCVAKVLQDLDKSRLFLLLLGVAGIAVGAIVLWPIIFCRLSPKSCTKPPQPPVEGVSSGGQLLTSALWSKQRGINEFADLKYSESLKLLKQSWREDRRDPETLIYLNNALLEAIKAEHYTIAIVVPIRRNQDGSIINANLAEELLRGIGQAQTEVNLGLLAANDSNKDFPGQGFLEPKAIKGKGLKVIIADDGNIKSYAVQRANYLVIPIHYEVALNIA